MEVFEAVVKLHGAEVIDAIDVAGVTAAEERYEMQVEARLEEMEHGIEDMEMCSDASGAPPEIDELAHDVERMHEESESHHPCPTLG